MQISCISRRCAYENIKRIERGDSVESKPKCGRPRKFRKKDFQRLSQFAIRNPVSNAQDLADRCRLKDSPAVCRRTILNYLKRMQFVKRMPIKKVELTDAQKRARLEWCLRYRFWDWERIWISDESYIRAERGRLRKWCPKRKKAVWIARRVRAVMIWAAISERGLTNVALISGSVNSARYTETLHNDFVQTANVLYPDGFWFQQDNARAHTAEATRNWMRENEIRVIEWPAYSPDLSPIENVWAVLKYRLCKRECKTFADLKSAIQKIWSQFDAGFSSSFLQTMEWRIERCIQLKGAYIDLNDMPRL